MLTHLPVCPSTHHYVNTPACNPLHTLTAALDAGAIVETDFVITDVDVTERTCIAWYTGAGALQTGAPISADHRLFK